MRSRGGRDGQPHDRRSPQSGETVGVATGERPTSALPSTQKKVGAILNHRSAISNNRRSRRRLRTRTASAVKQIGAGWGLGARVVAVLCVAAGSSVLGAVSALAASPSISLSPGSGPPGTGVTVSGSNSVADETIGVYFNIADLALASTSATRVVCGACDGPASAAAGTNWLVRHCSACPHAPAVSAQLRRDCEVL